MAGRTGDHQCIKFVLCIKVKSDIDCSLNSFAKTDHFAWISFSKAPPGCCGARVAVLIVANSSFAWSVGHCLFVGWSSYVGYCTLQYIGWSSWVGYCELDGWLVGQAKSVIVGALYSDHNALLPPWHDMA